MAISTTNRLSGIEYEKRVGEYYRNLGYIVIRNGECGEEYKSDDDVDLIAIKTTNNHFKLNIDISFLEESSIIEKDINITTEILLIQCKNYQLSKLDEKIIQQCIVKHKKYKQHRLITDDNHIIKSILAVSEKCIDYDIFHKYKNHKDIEIKHLELSANGEYVTLIKYGKK